MCEWLSSSDWCDVQLLCGGRSFRAHKAVLASVSNFLKRVLLSCPVDDVPIIIFLPEFDHDAMSSVLNYIYKGEVVIPKHKWNIFLDIVNAMEIYIDQRYIPIIEFKTENYAFSAVNKNNVKEKHVSLWDLCETQSQCCVNIKNGMSIGCLLSRFYQTLGYSNFCDNPSRLRQWSHENVQNLGNLISQYGFQQMQPYLRDTFIETYNQNGSGNGLTAGVLAISNERYRAPTSGLLTNVNGKYPTDNNTLSDKSENALQLNSQITSKYDFFKQLQYISAREENFNGQNGCNFANNISDKLKDGYTSNCIQINNSKNHTKSDTESSGITTSQIVLMKSSSSISSGIDSIFFSEVSKRCDFSVAKFSDNTFDSALFEKHSRTTQLNGIHIASGRTMPKVILNEVLQSPWHPRQPNNYKPFRIKAKSSSYYQRNLETKDSKEESYSENCIKRPRQRINTLDLITANKSDWKCSVCKQVFTNKVAYDFHMKSHLSISRYSCGECHKTFSQLRNFKYHMSIHRGTKEFATICPVCGKHFNDRGYLSSHMKIHKNRKEYKCPSCPKCLNQRVAYNMHVRIHTGVKPHVCEECGKAFSRKMLLKQHQRTHSGERPYACTHCDKRFADRSNMTLHLRLHTGEKPFSCTLCTKSFTKKHHLKAHLNFHTGAKPYSCPRCRLAFTQSSNMRTHYKKCNVAGTTT